jgi:hypothetical protein
MRRLLMQPPMHENVCPGRREFFLSHMRRLRMQPPIAENLSLG